MLIIGLVGTFGSGKTTAAKYLSGKGFFNVRLSRFIEEEIEKRNLGSIKDRKLLQDVGNELRKKFGSSILAERAVEYVKKNKASKIVVDGIRNVGEIEFLKRLDHCFIIGIDADFNLRFDRLKNMKARTLLTKEEFLNLELREKGKGQKDNGLQEIKCWEAKDYEISNDTSKENLEEKIQQFLKNIEK